MMVCPLKAGVVQRFCYDTFLLQEMREGVRGPAGGLVLT